MKERILRVQCPTCKKRGEWFGGPCGPFCSDRCKKVDLGKWFNEEHVISKPLTVEDGEEVSEDSLGPGGPPAGSDAAQGPARNKPEPKRSRADV